LRRQSKIAAGQITDQMSMPYSPRSTSSSRHSNQLFLNNCRISRQTSE